DYLSPMCYSQMVRQSAEWVKDVVRETDLAAPDKVLPSIQVSRAYLDEPFSKEDFHLDLLSALEEPSKGVILWSWETLEMNQEKLEIVKKVVLKE
ncbi:MAG: hypothetical protein KFF73_15365, partial [Cyclobacteriaceae bacterium]|nr:hypothetical protein [Cyclobacteriaceae bacterium]